MALDPREERFVSEYILCGVAADAARRAGFSGTYAQHATTRLMKRPEIVAAIEAATAKIRDARLYDVQMAMAELDKAEAFARETRNANAVVKAIEAKMRLNGLLIERTHNVNETLDINAAIDAAKARIAPPDLVLEHEPQPLAPGLLSAAEIFGD